MSQPRKPPEAPAPDDSTAVEPEVCEAQGPAADAGEVSPANDAAEQPDGGTEIGHPATQQLQARIEVLESKLSATLGQYKDALDGFEAAKARIKRELQTELHKSRRELMVPLLDVLDNLDRALESSQAQAEDALYKGVSMVREQFVQRLSAQGLRRMEAMGQAFNPIHFEAISTVPVSDAQQDGTVVGVVREAYVMGDETVRFGLVAVGKFAGA